MILVARGGSVVGSVRSTWMLRLREHSWISRSDALNRVSTAVAHKYESTLREAGAISKGDGFYRLRWMRRARRRKSAHLSCGPPLVLKFMHPYGLSANLSQ